MKKQDLIARLSSLTGLTIADTTATLNALEQITKETVHAGGKMVVPGVVTLTVGDRAARIGRNPATGAAVQIPAKRVIRAKLPVDLARIA